jgi:hypothetical protein
MAIPGGHFDPYLDQFPLAEAAAQNGSASICSIPAPAVRDPCCGSTALPPWPTPILRMSHKGGRDTRGRQGHACASIARVDRELLASAFPRRDS